MVNKVKYIILDIKNNVHDCQILWGLFLNTLLFGIALSCWSHTDWT